MIQNTMNCKGKQSSVGFDEKSRDMGAKARELAHLLRRLRRRAGRRHVGFRRPRGRGSGELHSIWARSDKWSWRRQKGENDCVTRSCSNVPVLSLELHSGPVS